MPDFSLADILGAQAGAPGPVYEGGPVGNVTPADVMGGLAKMPFPLRLIPQAVGAAALPGDVASGRVQADLSNPEYTNRAADLASLAVGSPSGSGGVGSGIRAYHGSPYDFDKFDLSRIGTGEGAQAYGHGLYFAENPAVAEEYKKSLSVQALEDYYRQLRETGSAPRPTPPAGKMYEVNINARPEQFINHDIPLADQPQQVSEALRSILDPKYNKGFYNDFATAGADPKSILQHLDNVDPVELSAELSRRGIPGIRYLDQGSRGVPTVGNGRVVYTGKGQYHIADDYGIQAGPFGTEAEATQYLNPHKSLTSNYVVFNPDIVDIRKKWALLLAAMGGAGAPTMGSVLQAQSQPPQ